jgi:hypothetical protein
VPTTHKHQIEINCNPRDAIILEKAALENTKMFKRLKEVLDKIKRINSTTMLYDPKLTNFTDDATSYIKQSVGKLINMTENINTTIRAYKMSKDLMDQITELTRAAPVSYIANKTAAEEEAENKNKELVEISKILESKHELNLTYIKDKFEQMNNAKHKLATLDQYVSKKVAAVAVNETKLVTEKDWIVVLDTLDEELDQKEEFIKNEATRTTTRSTTRSTSRSTQRFSDSMLHHQYHHSSFQDRNNFPSMNLKEIVSAAVLPNAQKQAVEFTAGSKKSSAGNLLSVSFVIIL